MLDFNWQVSIGDTVMDIEEFRQLLKKSEGLIKYKSHYIYADKSDVEKLLHHFNSSRELSSFELLQTAFSGEYQGVKISTTNEVKSLISQLTEFKTITLPESLYAQLLPESSGYKAKKHRKTS